MMRDDETLLERRKKVLAPSYRLFYDQPLHLVRAEGVEVWDADGTGYLDAYNNVPIVGHCHPRVVAAQNNQATILNTHTRYLGEGVVRYAEKLTATMSDELSQVILTCTGSEAIDLALRIAQTASTPKGLIISENAYHGVTASASSISPSLNDIARHTPWVKRIALPFDASPADVPDLFDSAVANAIRELDEAGFGVAALLFDMAFASDGIFLDPPGFPSQACARVQASGGLVIADEVQAGFGRLGSHMWGHQFHGISPDLVVLGKSMANGLPVGGVVGKPELFASFAERGRYFNTYAGNPVCMAAAEAVLDIIADENLLAHAVEVGDHLRAGLIEVTAQHGLPANIRGTGLFYALEFRDSHNTPDAQRSTDVMNALRSQGVLVGQCGLGNTAVKIRPPLPFSLTDADRLCEALDEVLTNI